MNTPPDGPLIVQSDKTLLLEVDHPRADLARRAIAPFAELERSPEHVHHRITPLGLWNARAAGHDAEQVVDALITYSRYAVPHALLVDVADTMDRYGRLTLEKEGSPTPPREPGSSSAAPTARSSRRSCATRRSSPSWASASTTSRSSSIRASAAASSRSCSRSAGLRRTWPATSTGSPIPSPWRTTAGTCGPIRNRPSTASGTVAPALSSSLRGGQDLVGAGAMAQAKATTLILVTNTVSARQWKDELVRRTTLTEDEIGEYSGARKEIRPVTIATYQVLTTRRKGAYTHLDLFDARDWGLIVYDEVHLLPAPIFRMTADLQARRRLGLTATHLVREDGREADVFSLIGPKRFDAPWKDIEAQGYIAPADCVEVRVTLPDSLRLAYATAEPEDRYRLASAPTSSSTSSRSWPGGTRQNPPSSSASTSTSCRWPNGSAPT